MIEHKYKTKQNIHDNKLKALISKQSIRKEKIRNNNRIEDNFRIKENLFVIFWR